MVLERPGALDEVYDRARAAYGDLHDPDHGFFSRALEVQPWRGLVEQLSEFVRVRDCSDREDGVCFRCSLEERRRWWRGRSVEPARTLWWSTVGPYAVLTETPAVEEEIRRVDVVAGEDDSGHPWGRRIVQVLQGSGCTLLTAADIETTVDFRTYDGRFPVSLFVMLFEDDDVPWWYYGR